MNDILPSLSKGGSNTADPGFAKERVAREELVQVASGSAPTGPPPRILLADDDGDVRKVLRRALERDGYQVDAVDDGEQAWESLKETPYDLLVTDNNMPRLTGAELVFRLRGEGQRLPVLLISGLSPWFEGGLARALVPGGMMQKPMTLPAFRLAVRSLLDEARKNAHAPPL